MSALDLFALIILLVLLVTFLAAWAVLGFYPGKIARDRNHPQQEAINVCGWLGAFSMGLLCPVAFIWAYTNPRWREEDSEDKLAEEEGSRQ